MQRVREQHEASALPRSARESDARSAPPLAEDGAFRRSLTQGGDIILRLYESSPA